MSGPHVHSEPTGKGQRAKGKCLENLGQGAGKRLTKWRLKEKNAAVSESITLLSNARSWLHDLIALQTDQHLVLEKVLA